MSFYREKDSGATQHRTGLANNAKYVLYVIHVHVDYVNLRKLNFPTDVNPEIELSPPAWAVLGRGQSLDLRIWLGDPKPNSGIEPSPLQWQCWAGGTGRI